jgi:hypothetical protein
MALCINGNEVFVNGAHKSEYKYPRSNDGESIRVSIDVIGGMISWERTHPTYLSIASLPIPETIRQKQLYPYI